MVAPARDDYVGQELDLQNRPHMQDRSHAAENRSFADLFRELRFEVMTLFRQEIALAKTEMSEKAEVYGRNLAYLAVGGAIAFAGFFVLLLAATGGLYAAFVASDMSHFTAGWLAPLIVGVITAVIGFAMIQKARSTLKSESLTPERTMQSLTEDKDWAKEKVTP